MLKRSFLAVGLCFWLVAACSAGEKVTTGTIVAEMIDFDRLCEMPVESYKTLQFSSYDRRSNLPGGPEWISNADGFGNSPIPPFVRTLKEPNDQGIGEYVMAEVEGPGAIVRTWTADINGSIRVYLDGADKPVFDGPAREFLHHPYNTFVGEGTVDRDTLEGTFYQRDAAYCPMPFAKSCRIEWIGNPRRVYFYYVQLRQYKNQDVEVETFQPEDLKTYADEMKSVAAVMNDPDSLVGEASNHEIDITLQPNERSTALEVKDSAALRRLMLLVEGDDEVAALRQTVMHITCDNWQFPQVQSPVGDFFAAAPGVNPYQSLPFTVAEDGSMISRYPMPFKESLKIEFHNMGDQPVKITGKAHTDGREWNDDRTMHFYARWRVTHDIHTPPALDIPFLLANGQGRYVGTASLMMNTAQGTHMGGTWWGEGDEKVFVDDDQMPSWFGTGSEDYYNYAWSAVDIFDYPYCGQPRNDGPGNRGFVANYRFHFIDDQPFHERIAFYMELLTNHENEGFSYACQSYHYGRPGIIDDHRVITKSDVRVPQLPGPWKPRAYHASTGATYYEPETLTDQAMEIEHDRLWSEGNLMIWKPSAVGDTLELTVPVPKPGKYELRVGLALDNRSGTVSATLDGKSFGFNRDEKMDLFDSRRTMLRASTGKPIELEAGDHVLTLKFEKPADGQEPLVGVDFIWLQPR
ncbi:glycoside hydrolase family 172 protein [Aeoliella sp.]|uniref:glycoside hydrolase family 172 protein n=1 Tax=Aeoliella sp. TaxID=2795800 RepID=UPI003CCC0AC2